VCSYSRFALYLLLAKEASKRMPLQSGLKRSGRCQFNYFAVREPWKPTKNSSSTCSMPLKKATPNGLKCRKPNLG
jgi:hypothetical protein